MQALNPIERIHLRQKLGREYAEEVELPVLLAFDGVKREKSTGRMANTVALHLVAAQCLFHALKAPKELDVARVASNHWGVACARPDHPLRLTTTEYMAVRKCLKLYFRALPKIEIGTYRTAANAAAQLMNS